MEALAQNVGSGQLTSVCVTSLRDVCHLRCQWGATEHHQPTGTHAASSKINRVMSNLFDLAMFHAHHLPILHLPRGSVCAVLMSGSVFIKYNLPSMTPRQLFES